MCLFSMLTDSENSTPFFFHHYMPADFSNLCTLLSENVTSPCIEKGGAIDPKIQFCNLCFLQFCNLYDLLICVQDKFVTSVHIIFFTLLKLRICI